MVKSWVQEQRLDPTVDSGSQEQSWWGGKYCEGEQEKWPSCVFVLVGLRCLLYVLRIYYFVHVWQDVVQATWLIEVLALDTSRQLECWNTQIYFRIHS